MSLVAMSANVCSFSHEAYVFIRCMRGCGDKF